jgi:hypothetical protein
MAWDAAGPAAAEFALNQLSKGLYRKMKKGRLAVKEVADAKNTPKPKGNGPGRERVEEKVAKTGRAKNKVEPDSTALGDHTAIKRNSDGRITNYATYERNPRNPTGFQEVKRADLEGAPHTNPNGVEVPTPHVKDAGIKGVHPARPDELPRGWSR